MFKKQLKTGCQELRILMDKQPIVKTKSAEKIHHDISHLLANGVTYIDALLHYSKQENMEIEALAEIVRKSSILKEKIRSEAVEMKMVKTDENISKLC